MPFTIRRYQWFFSLLMLTWGSAPGQPLVISLDTVKGCAGDTLLFDVRADQFNNVGAITLMIQYNPSELQYDTTFALHPQFPGMLVNEMTGSIQAIGFSWFSTSMSGVNLGTGVLATMKFIKWSDSSQLHFSPQCEIANAVGTPLPVTYQDGIILPRIPGLINQPSDVTAKPGQSAAFSIVPVQPATALQWFFSTDNTVWNEISDTGIFSGSSASSLSVSPVTWLQHGWKFKCRLTEGTCTGFSESATLWVDTIDTSDWLQNEEPVGKPYPNPCRNQLNVPVYKTDVYSMTITFSDITGKVVKTLPLDLGKVSVPGIVRMELFDIPEGLYLLHTSYQGLSGLTITDQNIIIVK
ncbi:MAG TPA: hypothetical protein P5338_03175 [Bacteroidales bacterium]|nr:hypothetical protein [Bacteroidales bacterium]